MCAACARIAALRSDVVAWLCSMHDVSFRPFLERTVVPVHDDNLVGALLSVVVGGAADKLTNQ